jgi:hypothetical protein
VEVHGVNSLVVIKVPEEVQICASDTVEVYGVNSLVVIKVPEERKVFAVNMMKAKSVNSLICFKNVRFENYNTWAVYLRKNVFNFKFLFKYFRVFRFSMDNYCFFSIILVPYWVRSFFLS